MQKLNEGQIAAYELADSFMMQSTHNTFFLLGCAGSGKTFAIGEIVKHILSENWADEVYMCAPTHQALNVLISNVQAIEGLDMDSINFMTIHKLLNFGSVITPKRGTKVFKQTKKKSRFEDGGNNLVIIDECSMLNRSLIKVIDSYINQKAFKVIFLGDPSQLAPVNEKLSKIFTIDKNYPFCTTLDEIMRTNSDDIKDVCSIVRTWNGQENICDLVMQVHSRPKPRGFNMFHYKTNTLESTWFKKFENCVRDNKLPIILSWYNATCNNYNRLIRTHLHGKADPNFLVDDYALFNNYYLSINADEHQERFYTSDMIKIVAVNRKQKKVISWKKYVLTEAKTDADRNFNALIKKIDSIECTFYVDNITAVRMHSEDTSRYMIKAIALSNLDSYNEYINSVKKHIEQYYTKYKSSYYISNLWETFHSNLVDPYAEIDFSYSITIYKSQGSTFDVVFVDVNDLYQMNDITAFQKALYTASGRASTELCYII